MKCINKLVLFGFLILGSSEVFSSEKVPTVQLRVLASHIAHNIVSAAVENCAQRGYMVSAAVVDRNGNLAAFLRNPLSGPHTIKVSQRKAFSSATLRARTSEMSFRSDLNFAPDILLIVGGVPIQFVGNFYGGVAVAGAKPEIDEQCAQAGIDAISEIMEFAE
ncbi:MAG: heme-binding protein [SAR324 cluster bacterium]|nr:heme-binding protein [SAR324 cluster bacterium]MDG1487889.1 heme-binding protein [SAR324 cluster bacterium]MDG2063374.1 heme-binding protein [SAR324 cluster bacterium]MDP7621692.1 heme-binding protein [SAR324 cluster bacterium]